MASSKHYFDQVRVPLAVMELFRAQPMVFVNRPPEQRTNIPTSPPPYGDRIWVDEDMRQFLKSVEPLLPMPMLLHFRGYGTQVGTVIITLKAVSWTNDWEEFPRLDFEHPEAMKVVNGCPNFWGSFILAMAPLGQYSDFGAEDPEGREFVRLYEQMRKAGNIREVEVTPPAEREELEVRKTKAQPKRVIRTISEIDWSQINPEHPVATTLVDVPTVMVRRKAEGCEYYDGDDGNEPHVVLQWYGDNDRGDLKDRKLQFFFPIFIEVDSPYWFGHPEWYRAVMVGKLSDWPDKGALAGMIEKGRSETESVVYLVTSQIALDDGRGGSKPSCILPPMAALGDGNFGVILPQPYSNWAVEQQEVTLLAAKKRR